MDLGLRGRRAIVTGGSAGIGRAIALALAAEGASVAIVGRDAERLHRVVAELGSAGAEAAHQFPRDLGRTGAAEAVVREAAGVLGGLDVLVNNVGAARQVSFDELVDDDWRRSFELNVLSHVGAIRAALPFLRESDQARIVNVASTAGKRPSTGMPDYSVMKAALLSLSRLVADIEAPNEVCCNALCPGPTRSEAWLAPGGLADQVAARAHISRDEALERTGPARPLGRMAETDEIAAVALFLCSAGASYVTGAAWSVDGGTVPIIL